MRQAKNSKFSGYTILLVDDNPEYLEATRILLAHEGHEVICAVDGLAALDILHQRSVDLALLDYYMPGITGEEVVSRLRQFNPFIQVILQTGYASEQPPRELLQRLDIQGYHDKNEGPERLLMWTDAGLKSASIIRRINKSRQGLRFILETTPALYKIRSLSELLEGLLSQICELLGKVDSSTEALHNADTEQPRRIDSFVATVEEDMELVVRAGTGRFALRVEEGGPFEDDKTGLVAEAMRAGEIRVLDDSTIIPLRVGETTIGVIYLDRPAILGDDVELLHVFSNQAAVAIQNTQLYALATLDSLTGAFGRGFFDKWLLREIRSAFRSRESLSLLMVDLNAMKRINDTAGHLAGDQALMKVGKALRQATRTTDIVGRYGGDEFALVLPQSDREGADIVANRILDLLACESVPAPGGNLPVTVSIGVCTLMPPDAGSEDLPRGTSQVYFLGIAQELIKKADEALYVAKKDKEKRVSRGEPAEWLSVEAAGESQ